ncbi:hypothetical protein M3B46_02355 [Sphingobacterium daejeonense]|uniref:hypothetical protein n=1 Tax=Sphingobacterium daejeonense TaxID=371142 RepID=UPI0021A3716C|nr:hypothetical protein [Sphingobacterium daejeonense]MCT1529818.1 hypothetical protein [Sphingobacterium daejeonense]
MKRKLLVVLFILFNLNSIAQEIQDETNMIFINKNPKELYLGAILKISSLDKDKYEIVEGSNLPQVTYLMINKDVPPMTPNLSSMRDFIRKEIKGEDLSTIVSTGYPKVQKVESYEKLGAVFGERINPEIMLAVNPKSKKSKSVYVATFTNMIYTINCQTDIVKAKAHPALKGLDPKDLMYVEQLSFGRFATIFIESDAEYEKIEALVQKKYEKKALTDQEESIIANSTIHFQILDYNETGLATGDPFDVIREYISAPITENDFLRPIWISGINLNDGDMVYTPLK